MNGPVAWLNDRWIPADEAKVSVADAGFVQGVTVAEQMRTFHGRLFGLDRHLARLKRSLAIIGVASPWPLERLGELAVELAARNRAPLADGDDLALALFVTPGPYPTMAAAPGAASGPTVGMHTYPLPFSTWVDKYDAGERLVVTDVEQVPTTCWPAELKCRSRMHYYLADRAARARDAGARALMVDRDGWVTEASTANLLLYRDDEGLISPPMADILPGVTVGSLFELAAELGVKVVHRRLRVDDVLAADEALLCSTSPVVWGVASLDGQSIGTGKPGPMAKRLLRAFSEKVGVDVKTQAKTFASRS